MYIYTWVEVYIPNTLFGLSKRTWCFTGVRASIPKTLLDLPAWTEWNFACGWKFIILLILLLIFPQSASCSSQVNAKVWWVAGIIFLMPSWTCQLNAHVVNRLCNTLLDLPNLNVHGVSGRHGVSRRVHIMNICIDNTWVLAGTPGSETPGII